MIEENQVGTTVKVDDQKSDPYAVLSIINLTHQKVKSDMHTCALHQEDLISMGIIRKRKASSNYAVTSATNALKRTKHSTKR